MTNTIDPTMCDCSHPVSYHHDAPAGGVECHWSPPHSARRCGCKEVTQTGRPRDETFSTNAPKESK